MGLRHGQLLILTMAAFMAVALAQRTVANATPVNPCFKAGIMTSVVFLGRFVPQPSSAPTPPADTVSPIQYHATGFLLQIDNRFYIVTAKHVVEEFASAFGADADMIAFLNDKAGQLVHTSLRAVKQMLHVDWIVAYSADLAILPFAITEEFDVKFIPDNLFLSSDNVVELQDVFFLSYQPGIQQRNKITPIARGGMVSVRNADRTFYLDAFAFPGNSGSPVFIKPSAIGFSDTGISLGADPNSCKFVGVIGEYLPYQEVAISMQTKRPRVMFEENTGLAKVWPVEALGELLRSPEFIAQQEELSRRAPMPTPALH